MTLAAGDNPLTWKVDQAQFPNFTLTAALMSKNTYDEAKLDLEVERKLQVTVETRRPVVAPREEIELEITTTDQLGRPVSAELSVAMVDQSLFRQFEDRLPAIGPYFYDQTRTGAFAARATNTFRYDARTTPVATAIVEDAEREAAVAANAADRDKVLSLEAKDKLTEFGMAAGKPAATENNKLGYAEQLDAPAAGKLSKPGKIQGQFGFAERRRAKAGMGGRGGQLAEGELGGANAGFLPMASAPTAPAPARERFVETAYWNPAIVTDKEGKARVRFKAAAALADYRITARGVSEADTLVGQTNASLTVRKNFSVDLKVPVSLTQGDKPRFLAAVQHMGVKGKASLRLSVYSGGRDEVYPATVEIEKDGVSEILFDPIDIADADSVRLTLVGTIGDVEDKVTTEIPIRPWGVPAYAFASGTSAESTTAFVGLPPGRSYENADMVITISPTLRRMLIEIALGQSEQPLDAQLAARVWPPACNTLIDQASDLVAATSALSYLRDLRGTPAPEAPRLVARIRGLVSGLLAAQNDDGGWPRTPPGYFAARFDREPSDARW